MRCLSVVAGPRPAAGRAFGRPARQPRALAPPSHAQAAPSTGPSSMFNMLVDGYVRDGLLSREEAERCSREQLEFLIRKRTGSPPADASSSPPASAQSVSPDQARLQAYVQDGLLTPEEMASCSQAQIEFLVRKRTTQGASNSVVPAPPRRTSSSPRPASQRPPSPVPAANGWGQSPQPQGGNGEEAMSAEQLELLREYLRAQEEQEALLQAQVENLKREVEQLETEQQVPAAADQGGVIPFMAPPLTDSPPPPRATSPAPTAQQQQPAAPSSEGGTNWAGVAAAGLVVAGLSAAVYFAPEDALKGAAPPLPKSEPAVELERSSGPVPFGAAPQAVQPAPAVPKPAPPPPAPVAPPAAVQLEAPAAPAVVPVPTPAPKVEAPKPEQRAAPAPVQQAAPAAAVKKDEAKEDEAKSASRLAAEKAAAELAAELTAKQAAQQQAKTSAAAPTNYTSLGVGVLLAAAAALAAPQSRAAARSLLDRFRGEAALVKAAQARYETLKKSVEVQAGDFSRLQEKLSVAQNDYVRALAALKSTASELEGLFGRVQGTEKQTAALLTDLEKLEGGNKQAKQLRAEAARVAASVASQRAAVEKALQQALKDL